MERPGPSPRPVHATPDPARAKPAGGCVTSGWSPPRRSHRLGGGAWRPRDGMNPKISAGSEEIGEAELGERLQWLLRLRWLIVPVFVAVDLTYGLLTSRRAPWTAIVVGGVLLAANALYSQLLARGRNLRALLRWARFESALVTAVPLVVVVLHGDPTNALRYGVLVGVVGAAVVLPRTSEVAVVGMWAVAALIIADAA